MGVIEAKCTERVKPSQNCILGTYIWGVLGGGNGGRGGLLNRKQCQQLYGLDLCKLNVRRLTVDSSIVTFIFRDMDKYSFDHATGKKQDRSLA
jgi:hypothetical protein